MIGAHAARENQISGVHGTVAWIDAAIAVLQRIVNSDLDSQGKAYVSLAELYEEAGRDDEVIQSMLEKAIEVSPDNTHRNLMDSGNTRNIAVRRLAKRSEARGDWKRAHELYSDWRPYSWCGNGLISLYHYRAAKIANAESRMGLVDEALERVWEYVSEESCLNGGIDLEMAGRYAAIAQLSGVLDAA